MLSSWCDELPDYTCVIRGRRGLTRVSEAHPDHHVGNHVALPVTRTDASPILVIFIHSLRLTRHHLWSGGAESPLPTGQSRSTLSFFLSFFLSLKRKKERKKEGKSGASGCGSGSATRGPAPLVVPVEGVTSLDDNATYKSVPGARGK